MNWAEFLLGQLPEAIYFALFMIFAKNLRTKRVLFALILIFEYFILLKIFDYNIWFQATYTFMMFVILRFLYGNTAQITDIFTFMICSISLMLITGIVYLICNLFNANLIVIAVISRLLMFALVLVLNYRLYKIQKLYKVFWNRNDKVKKKVKSLTFRCWNLIFFNFMFYILGVCMQNINLI